MLRLQLGRGGRRGKREVRERIEIGVGAGAGAGDGA